MKLLHLSDLHLGKRVNDYSLREDQEHVLGEILRIADETAPDAVLIAGDVYDRALPSAEAVSLFDDFLVRLAVPGRHVFVISGNHDSPERIAYGGRLMDRAGVHLSPVYAGSVEPIVLEDTFGPVSFYLLPFVRPANVRRFFPEDPCDSFTEAVGTAIAHMGVDTTQRNVLLAHQFVTGAERSDSEEVAVGGLDNVDVSVFAPFDYTALGHIHGPQSIGCETVRYCGTPMKYSFSEVDHVKSATLVTLGEKGSVTVETVPLTPLRDWRKLRGTYMELTSRPNYEGTAVEDYLHVTLTDEQDVPGAMENLLTIYPNIMTLTYDNTRTRAAGGPLESADADRLNDAELFELFFRQRTGKPLSDEQRAYTEALFDRIREDAE